MEKNASFRTKLLTFFVLAMLVLIMVGLYNAVSSRMMLQDMDRLLRRSAELTAIYDQINDIQNDLESYLSTRSSDVLQQFYSRSNALANSSSVLNGSADYTARGIKLKNLSEMLTHYLSTLDSTVIAKRNENVQAYALGYAAAEKEHGYIGSYIQQIMRDDLTDSAEKYALLQDEVRMNTMINYVLMAVTIVLVMGGTFVFSFELTKPISKLASYAKAVSEGEFDVEVEEDNSSREINILFQTFRMMIGSIRTYVSELTEKGRLEQKLAEEQINSLQMKNSLHEAELLALQYQMNPHFIFNTINIGAKIAMMQGDGVTCEYLENAAEVFRYNLRGLDYNATLQEELENVTAYANLLSTRFGNRATFQISVPKEDRILSFRLPRMTLQPLIENAFIHGVSKLEGGGIIGLTANWNGDRLYITVSNMGEAIAEDRIERILSGESGATPDPSRKGHTTGIGIDNVLKRLRMFFEIEDVMSIICGGGRTNIILKLPIRAAQEDGGNE